MCLSPSLFPLPPLSPTVLEPYLKAKRKTGFNTPVRAFGGASPAGATHRPDGGQPERCRPGCVSGPRVSAPRCSPGRGWPAPGTRARLSWGSPGPAPGPWHPGGHSSLKHTHTPRTPAACRGCRHGGTPRSSALAALEQLKRFPRGSKRVFIPQTHPHQELFFTEGNIYRLYRLGIMDFFFSLPPSPFRFRSRKNIVISLTPETKQ